MFFFFRLGDQGYTPFYRSVLRNFVAVMELGSSFPEL